MKNKNNFEKDEMKEAVGKVSERSQSHLLSDNKITKKFRCYFMIINLVVAVFAFGWGIGMVSGADVRSPPTSTPVPGNSGAATASNPFNLGREGGSPGSGNPTPVDSRTDTGTQPPGDGTERQTEGNPEPPINPNIEPPQQPNQPTGSTGLFGGLGSIFNILSDPIIQKMIWYGTTGAGMFGAIGAMAGGDKGGQWGALAGAVGGAVAGLAEGMKWLKPGEALLLGLGVATMIFIFTYKKASTEITEFHCLPWQAPIGGEYCSLCNKFEQCSEYTCKSLGQACAIVNAGTKEQRCVWQNPYDTKSPVITFEGVSKEHDYKPDLAVRPPTTGVNIFPKGKDCIRAFFPLEFRFKTNEPAQCKIDYNLTESTKENPKAGYENMNFYVGGDALFVENHSEKLSLPGPEAMNAENPELKNDGHYTLFVRCMDANGNFNQDPFSVSFCVEKGPDVTQPLIINTNIPTGNPVRFNQSKFDLEVYINEPSECKWSRVDQSFKDMEQTMSCDTRVWQMNNNNVYTCKTTLTGVMDRKDNDYYFRCKDQPLLSEGDRNENKQSYKYVIKGTQPLNIMNVLPNGTIKGASDVIPVFLTISTDNGYENGNSLCYYYHGADNSAPTKDSDYLLFHETQSNKHEQRQDLVQGNYKYYFKCVDLGGNAVYSSTEFFVESDRSPPLVIRAYKDSGLKIITNEKATCTYSITDCNFEIESGIEMASYDKESHIAEWVVNKKYYIRCSDEYNNQPNPNTCSIILRPSESSVVEEENKNGDWFDF